MGMRPEAPVEPIVVQPFISGGETVLNLTNPAWMPVLALALAVAGELSPEATAQVIKTQPAKPRSDVKEIDLEASPTPAPTPIFRQRLLPRESDRTPGDAAPIYLRLSSEDDEEARRQLKEKPHDWLQLPLDQFPRAEARAFVDQFSKRLRQLDFGARRRTCEWNYTVPEEWDHLYEVSLADAQQMRGWGRLVALKARVEVAEGKFDEASRTLETGLSFARHVGKGPYFINVLIGISIASQMLAIVEEWVGLPDAPNLYWPLTALPRPLIPARDSMENEQKTLDTFIPELDELERPRADAEWSLLLSRYHERKSYWMKLLAAGGSSNEPYLSKPMDLETFKSSLLPEAQAFVKDRRGSIVGWSDDRVLVHYVAGRYREFRDDLFKQGYLPVTEATGLWPDVDKRVHALKSSPFALFAAFTPAIAAVQSTESRLDRNVAALRVVEAVRLQAHADGGKLPESLAKVTAVPVPLDPSTGRPFEERREGEVLSVIGPRTRGGIYIQRIECRIRLRR